jgi:hypothetical protein
LSHISGPYVLQIPSDLWLAFSLLIVNLMNKGLQFVFVFVVLGIKSRTCMLSKCSITEHFTTSPKIFKFNVLKCIFIFSSKVQGQSGLYL